MDVHQILSNPAVLTALNALVAWGITQGVKKLGANPRYAPYIAIASGAAASIAQGFAGNGPDSFPMQAVLGAIAGLVASGSHEAVQKARPVKP